METYIVRPLFPDFLPATKISLPIFYRSIKIALEARVSQGVQALDPDDAGAVSRRSAGAKPPLISSLAHILVFALTNFTSTDL